MPGAPFPSCDHQKCVQTCPNVPWEAKSSPIENHWSRCCWNMVRVLKIWTLSFMILCFSQLKHCWHILTISRSLPVSLNVHIKTYINVYIKWKEMIIDNWHWRPSWSCIAYIYTFVVKPISLCLWFYYFSQNYGESRCRTCERN